MNAPVLLVRLLPGVVGESRRMVHLVPMPPGDAVPDMLTAHCGETIQRGQAEMLNALAGMPCSGCLLLAPTPGTLPDGGQPGFHA